MHSDPRFHDACRPLRCPRLASWVLCTLAGRALGDDVACPPGYHQFEPVVLGCTGGSLTKTLILTPAGTAHSSFNFHSPPGAVGLAAAFHVKSKHGEGVTLMHASCGSELILGAGGDMNNSILRSHVHGADWSWGGNPSEPRRGSWDHWFDVAGQLDCIINVELANVYASTVVADLGIRWEGVIPCPDLLPGCQKCPSGTCKIYQQAVCDGSPFVECIDRAAPRPQSGPMPSGNVTVIAGGLKLSLAESTDLNDYPEAAAALRQGIGSALGEAESHWVTITRLSSLDSIKNNSHLARVEFITKVPSGAKWEVTTVKKDLSDLAVDLRRGLNSALHEHHVEVSVVAVQILSFNVLSRPSHQQTISSTGPPDDSLGGHFGAFTPFVHAGAPFPRPSSTTSSIRHAAPTTHPPAQWTSTASPHFLPVPAEGPESATNPYKAFAVPAFFAAAAVLSCACLVGKRDGGTDTGRPTVADRDGDKLFARGDYVDAEPLVPSNAGYVDALDSERTSREDNYLRAEIGNDGL